MDTLKLKQELERDEGIKLAEYKDHLGYSTIGIGRLIDARKGGGITKDEAYYLLGNDIKKVEAQLNARLPWWTKLNDNRQRAIANMCFQLGIDGLLGFANSLKLIEQGKWEDAAKALKLSKWYTQTPTRAGRVIEMIRVG